MDAEFAITADTTPTPESLCPFLLYLCTDDAANITGSLFTVYGNTVQLHQQPIIMNTIAKAGSEFWTVDELRAEVPRNLLVDYQNILAYQ
jgi:hypothetical protein